MGFDGILLLDLARAARGAYSGAETRSHGQVMAIDLEKVGSEVGPFELPYDWRTLALYALGIGAKASELDYLYEGRGPKIYPSFAVVPAYPVLSALLDVSKTDLSMALHQSQRVRVLSTLPPAGVLQTTGKLKAIYDLKRMAQLVFETRSSLEGEIVFTTEWTILFRNEGDFGGPKRERVAPVRVPEGASPDFVVEDQTSPEQALLYRLSGDYNPLHADPEFAKGAGFERGPLLHGLATFGFVCRAVVHGACGGDAERLRELSATFQNPVWPGEKLRTEGFRVNDRWLLQTFADDRPQAVVGNCYAVVA